MKRMIPFAMAALVLSFGSQSAAADPVSTPPGFGQLDTSPWLAVTFTEGWLEREVTERGPRKCFKRCKKHCKRKYKRCKRKFGKKYCKHKRRKCKRKCRRRCRY